MLFFFSILLSLFFSYSSFPNLFFFLFHLTCFLLFLSPSLFPHYFSLQSLLLFCLLFSRFPFRFSPSSIFSLFVKFSITFFQSSILIILSASIPSFSFLLCLPPSLFFIMYLLRQLSFPSHYFLFFVRFFLTMHLI